MQSLAVYHLTDAGLTAVTPDPGNPEFYRDVLLRRGFDDVFGHVPADADGIIMADGEVFYSSSAVEEPWVARDFMIGDSDLYNGCWAPDPRDAVPEYVGVRFQTPVLVTGFQFVTGVSGSYECPMNAAPCGHPTSFVLEGSNDETVWTPLVAMTDFVGMRITFESPFADEDSSWWDDGVFLSDRLDIVDPHYFLAYRMVISAFKPDVYGTYSLSELIFYGGA